MMPFDVTFILLLLSSILAGGLDATVGGGGFVLIPFLVFLGSPIQLAIGTSRVIFLMDSFSAVVGHARKRSIDYKIAFCYSIPALLGAPIGAHITSVSSPETISKIFGFFMLAMLFLIASKPNFGLKNRKSRGLIPSLLAGFFIGFMIGLLGGGVGVLIIIALVFISGTTVLLASGTSQVIVWITNIVALVAYYSKGLVDLKLGLILGVMAIIGAQLGVIVAHKVGNRWLRILLIVITITAAIKLLA